MGRSRFGERGLEPRRETRGADWGGAGRIGGNVAGRSEGRARAIGAGRGHVVRHPGFKGSSPPPGLPESTPGLGRHLVAGAQ